MRDPVFVIYGVANTNEKEFNDRVTSLSARLENRWELVPVFWNCAGSDPQGIEAAIPPFTLGSGVRDAGDALPSTSPRSAGFELANAIPERVPEASSVAVRDADGKVDVVAQAAAARLGVTTEAVRDPDEGQAKAVQVAIQAVWGELEYLTNVSDRRVLENVGTLVADAISERGDEGDEGIDTRGQVDPLGLVRAVLHGVDRVVGAVTGVAGEGLLWTLRTTLLPMFGKGIGDVLVYELHRAEIGAIVRDKLAKYGNPGTADHPAMVIGHSLGGIIAFDLAVGPSPVYWSSLVTFGSQSPVLHVLDPRSTTSLARYQPNPPRPVQLPPTIRRWTNIYEPWDPLAFFASKVFDGQNRQRIVDIEIPH